MHPKKPSLKSLQNKISPNKKWERERDRKIEIEKKEEEEEVDSCTRCR